MQTQEGGLSLLEVWGACNFLGTLNYNKLKRKVLKINIFRGKGNQMYTVKNFKTKKELKEAVANGEEVRIYAPGLGEPKRNGIEYLEGPHYPQPHKWYAEVTMKDGLVVKVK